MLDPGQQHAAQYSAFISYCRRDEKRARWLQSALERYRMPSRLVGKPTPRGPVPRKFLPVFRDRSELTAAPDLREELVNAMALSANLIVLCTPGAAVSDWVDQEIRIMREAGRSDRILAALFEGDEQTAFPLALRNSDLGPVSPLAADFRANGDGRRLALLKLVAVMAGLGLGELLRREDAQRMRRLTGIAAASAAGMAAFGAITVAALEAKSQAEQERAKSERMVETLVTDLRDAVKPLGSLAALGQVNKAALGYFSGQSLEALPETALAQRARLLIAMGEDELAQGRPAMARTHFEEAHRTTATRLDDRPRDADRIFDHAQSEFWLGYAAWQAGEIAQAEARFGNYARLSEELVSRDPARREWQMEAGYAAINRGVLALRHADDAVRAETLFKTALDHFNAAGMGQAPDRVLAAEIGNGFGWLADAHRAQGENAAARTCRMEQLRLVEAALSRNRRDVELRASRIVATLALARLEADDGDAVKSLRLLEDARHEAADLARSDPLDANAAQQLRMIQLFSARSALLLPQGRRPSLAGVARDIGNCTPASPALDLSEIVALCRLVLARLHAVRGEAARARALALAARMGSAPPMRLSEGWGIDFATEERAVLALAGEGE